MTEVGGMDIGNGRDGILSDEAVGFEPKLTRSLKTN